MFIDHDVELAFKMATHVTLLHQGAVVAQGSPDEVRAMPILDEIYLGGVQRA
jgi:branched-chain amino acid transport system ATP-binding protein